MAAFIGVAAALGSTTASADCVLNAQNRDSITVVDWHTVLLSGGRGPDILVKTLAKIERRASIAVVRDSFCSFAYGVLLVDGELVSVGRVTALR